MIIKKTSLTLSLFLLAMFGFHLAEAKRFGSGSNHGYTRSNLSAYNSNVSSLNNTSSYKSSNTPSYKKSGTSILNRVLTAVALGTILSWLFSAQGIIGLMVVFALAMIIFILITRRKITEDQEASLKDINRGNSSLSSVKNILGCLFSSSKTRKNFKTKGLIRLFSSYKQKIKSYTSVDSMGANGIIDNLLIDGTPESVFNSQALHLFKQIQLLNNRFGIESLKNYVTKDLYNSVLEDINRNDKISEFKDLNCKVVNCDRQDDQRYTAGVIFVGMYRENQDDNWQNFEELWYFSRKDNEHLWKVSGIQQF